MRTMQVFNTLKLIANNEAMPIVRALFNYCHYLINKVINNYPDYIKFSNSNLYFD